MRAALLRARVPLAVQVGLLPVWVIGMFNFWYRIAYWDKYYPNYVAARLIIVITIWLGWLGMNLLAAIFGVRQGLRSRGTARNIAVSLVLIVLIPVVCFIPTMTLLGPTLKAMELDLLTVRTMIGLIFALFILLPYGLAAALYWWPNKPK